MRSKPRTHQPGPIRRNQYGTGGRLTCSCGKRVTSTGNDETLWSAFRQHEKRALAREAAPDTTMVKRLTHQLARSALQRAKDSSPAELAELEDELRLALLRVEER